LQVFHPFIDAALQCQAVAPRVEHQVAVVLGHHDARRCKAAAEQYRVQAVACVSRDDVFARAYPEYIGVGTGSAGHGIGTVAAVYGVIAAAAGDDVCQAIAGHVFPAGGVCLQVFHVVRQGVVGNSPPDVNCIGPRPCTRRLDHFGAGIVHDVCVVACAANQEVIASPALQGVVAVQAEQNHRLLSRPPQKIVAVANAAYHQTVVNAAELQVFHPFSAAALQGQSGVSRAEHQVAAAFAHHDVRRCKAFAEQYRVQAVACVSHDDIVVQAQFVGIGAGSADHGIVSCPTVNGVVAAAAGDDVVQSVAGHVFPAGGVCLQVFHVVRQRVVGNSPPDVDGIDPRSCSRRLEHHGAGIVHVVCVVACAAN